MPAQEAFQDFSPLSLEQERALIESDDKNVGGLDTLGVYTDGFMLIAKYALGAGLIVIVLSPLMKKLMGKIH